MSSRDLKIPLAWHYTWQNVPDSMLSHLFAEYREHGGTQLVFSWAWLQRILTDPAFFPELMHIAKKQGVYFTEAHGIWGASFGMGVGGRFRSGLEHTRNSHKLAMSYAAEAGCRTYTVHMGAYDHIYFGTPVEVSQKYAVSLLEELIVEAEKCNIVIACENNFDNTGSADALLPVLRHFDSPFLGCCFDTGHANILEPSPGKTPEIYRETGLERTLCANALEKLTPYIVTCHLNDNDGKQDLHLLPGKGTISWNRWLPRLRVCPRLISFQTEVNMFHNVTPVSELFTVFRSLLKEEFI